MGIDASLFAKNAKKRCYFDRLYNLADVWELKDELERNEGVRCTPGVQEWEREES